MKPILGITIGDIGGIGPEVVFKALMHHNVWKVCEPWVYAPPGVLEFIAQKQKVPLCEILFGHSRPKQILVRPVSTIPFDWIASGKIRKETARLAIDCLSAAFKDISQGRIHGMVTAPVHKGSIVQAGIPFQGHTELLADWAKVDDVVMMMSSSRLKVALVTNHLPIRKVVHAITKERILKVIQLFYDALKKLGIKKPKIAVTSLNPHGGEDGGKEEKEVIKPAVQEAKRKRIAVEGPLSSDALFHQAYHGKYDGVVAMFHDQALGPLKIIAFDEAVNVTLGLPFVRTSPDHGTAFDIAGKNIAREDSMVEAILLAAQLCKKVHRP